MKKSSDRPQFELRQVHEDGSEEIGLYTLEEASSQLPGVVVGRRAFVGLAALLGSALALTGCEIFEIPPTETPAPSRSPIPSRSPTVTRTITTTRTITNTPTISRTPIASITPRPGSTTPEGLVTISSNCGSIKAHTSTVYAVKFSPDGSLLATGCADKTARLWSTKDWSIQDTVQGHTNTVLCLAFSPDNEVLATGSSDYSIRLYPYKTKSTASVLTGHTQSIYTLAFSPDGKLLASASADKSVIIWSVKDKTLVKKLDGAAPYSGSNRIGLAFSPDGTLLAVSSSNNEVKLYSTPDWSVFRVLRGHTSPINALAFSPNGSTLLSGASDRTLRVWDYRTGVDNILSTENILSLAYIGNGSLFASSHSDYNIRIWSASKNSMLYLIIPSLGSDLATSPSGDLLAVCGLDTSVAIFNLSDTEPGQQACLMDKNATASTTNVNSYRITVGGYERVYVLPSTTKVPTGATCSCVPVAGIYKAPTTSSGGGGGSICTCNKICTCIPVPKYCFVMFREERIESRE